MIGPSQRVMTQEDKDKEGNRIRDDVRYTIHLTQFLCNGCIFVMTALSAAPFTLHCTSHVSVHTH